MWVASWDGGEGERVFVDGRACIGDGRFDRVACFEGAAMDE